MKLHLTAILLLYATCNFFAQETKPTIYLLHGQGADERLFSKFEFPDHKAINIKYHVPKKGTSMKEYAHQLAPQINTNEKFILIGTSIGGMLSSEMAEFLKPETIIIISSAKNRNELPARYTFQKKFPIYKLVSPSISKTGAMILQPIVEPDRKNEKETFKAMLKAKDKNYMRNSIEMIVSWDKEENVDSIIHIHGDDDSTIPIKNVTSDYVIKEGSHMMTLTRGVELSKLINKILKES